jgi:cysteinyl-tRNA synthetase
MANLYLTNSLTHKKEEFTPNKKEEVGIYSCGPTVYWNQHIGHMYAYIQWDALVRFLRYEGFTVDWVVNITDVGHMTGENEGAADTGEDKMEKGAKREGVSVWKIADKYIAQFKESLSLLNITTPDVMPRATEHIEDQVKLIKKIEKNGFTYKTKMGLVFDTSKFKEYTKFSGLDLSKAKKRADVEDDPEKKNPGDFFLWVTGNPNHIMKWPSPWGEGYPGWHIECTAMSTRYLGDNFDIHTGGLEHIPVHHTNEIAQGFAAFGKQTANYWLHNAWLMGKGGQKMSKSLGNIVTIQELVEKGYNPLAFRYLVLTSHYKKGLNFTYEALDSAQTALSNLRAQVLAARQQTRRTVLSKEKEQKVAEFNTEFVKALSDDLNAPQALATLWSALKSNIPSEDKYDLAMTFDEVLGLGLSSITEKKLDVPSGIIKLRDKREDLRNSGKFDEADKVREEIEAKGYILHDTSGGTQVKLKN